MIGVFRKSMMAGLVAGLVTALASAAAVAAPHAAGPVPDSFLLGRDATGEPCSASRTWNDPRGSRYDRTYAITCRGAAAGRSYGTLVVVDAGYPWSDDGCAEARKVEVDKIGTVAARQCFDAKSRTPMVSASFKKGKYIYRGEAVFTAAGPMEAGLRTLTGEDRISDRYADTKAAIVAADLPAVSTPAATPASEPVREAFLPDVILGNGILLNQQGAYVEASRLLNGGLSRLTPETSVITRAEFYLEAGIADSNIGQTGAADAHFAEARKQLAPAEGGQVSAYLMRKLSTYEALDANNRRQWRKALDALEAGESAANPLTDMATISALNQPASGTANTAGAVADRGELSGRLLEAQRSWAASIAWLGVRDVKKSSDALDQAVAYTEMLQRSVRADSLLGIKARIERQNGRIQAFRNKPREAVRSFDCALALLQGVVLADSSECRFDARPSAAVLAVTGSTTFSGPIIADIQMERASLLSRDRAVDRDEVIKAYSTSIDALLATRDLGARPPAELQPYFDILVERAASGRSPEAVELYFKAIQSVGEPAVARQMAQLRDVVTGNSAIAAKVKDRNELERRVIQLRYQISSSGTLDDAARGALETQRNDAENRLLEVNAELTNDPQFKLVDDQLVRAAEVQGVLKSGEYFLKITQLKTRSYAIVLSPRRAWLFRIGATSDQLSAIAKRVRASIRDDSGKVPFFDVSASYAMFSLVAGPAASELRLARSIIVDPSGPLENLPASVLVTSADSVKRYVENRAVDPYDYSHVDFIAYRSDVYYALSPRSLLVSRSLTPSRASKPFIGFGENAPPPDVAAFQGRKLEIGGCQMEYSDFFNAIASNKPVSAREISLAARAMGLHDVPEVTGAEFSDTGLLKASDQGTYEQYQVVHFATHGIPESELGCSRIPPSLITSVAMPEPGAGAVSDGFLTFPEVAQLRFDANLVVLSACDTAAGVSGELGRLSGQDESSATLDGLVRAFITARARAVMATYWNVPASAETDQLIETFYSSGRIYGMSAALRTAQTRLIGQPRYSHPYYWGAYVLIGDGTKSMLSPKELQTASR